jgi:integrase
MARQKLTKTSVEAIAPGPEDVVVWDLTLPGFGLRVKPTGVRSYIVQHRNRESGASKRLTIGQHGSLLTLEQAKKQARGLLADAMRGKDPVAERRTRRTAPTIADMATDYLNKYAGPKKRPKSVRDDRAMLQNIILPRLGSQKVAAVGRREIEALHASLEDRPYQANRVLALLSKMFNLAIGWGWRTDNPVKGLKRYEEEKRHRWLQDDELQRLCSVLDRRRNQRAANVVRLQLLTGARMGEVLGAKKADFDLNRGVWIKPSHQTKQKRTEHLPLSAPAVALVASLIKRTSDSPYLVPGNVEGANRCAM